MQFVYQKEIFDSKVKRSCDRNAQPVLTHYPDISKSKILKGDRREKSVRTPRQTAILIGSGLGFDLPRVLNPLLSEPFRGFIAMVQRVATSIQIGVE
jgi:hypothetical protein